jgi:hypothetical protein
MATSLFKVKRYAHPKYKFVVRAKITGCDENDPIDAKAENERGRHGGTGSPASPDWRYSNFSELRPMFFREAVKRLSMVASTVLH